MLALSFLYEMPVSLVIVWPVFAVALWALLAIPRTYRLGGPGRAMSALLVVWALIIVPFVPLIALLAFCLVVIAVLVVAFTVGMILIATPWGRRRILPPIARRRAAALERAGFTIRPGRLPRELRARAARLLPHGFGFVTGGSLPNGIKIAVLVRGDGILAHVLRVTGHIDPRVVVELFSFVVSGTKGVYSTANFGIRSTDAHPGPVLVEVYPYEQPAALLARHEEGRVLLQRRGLRFAAASRGDAVTLTEATLRGAVAHIRASSAEQLSGWKMLKTPRPLLELLSDARYEPVLAAMRDEEMATTGPGRDARGSGPDGPGGTPPPAPA